METTSDICKQFHAIAESGFPVADSTLQRKAVVSVKKGKLVFSQQQLKQVVIMLMGDLPYFLFRPKSITKDYVILLFWSTSLDDSACEVRRKADVHQQEIAAEYQLRLKTEYVATPTRQFRYLMNNYELMHSQNDEICHLPPLDHEFLETFFAIVQEQKVSPKKRKTMDPIENNILSAV